MTFHVKPLLNSRQHMFLRHEHRQTICLFKLPLEVPTLCCWSQGLLSYVCPSAPTVWCEDFYCFLCCNKVKIILENEFSQEFQSTALIFTRRVQNKVTTIPHLFFKERKMCKIIQGDSNHLQLFVCQQCKFFMEWPWITTVKRMRYNILGLYCKTARKKEK